MMMSSKFIRNAHLATIFFHILIAVCVIVLTYYDNDPGLYITGSLLGATSLLSLVPILQTDYTCDKLKQ